MTSLLLDTHAVLWFFWDDPRLSERAKSLIEDANTRKYISIASCWEIAIKASLHKLELGEPSRVFLPREIARNNFELLPITLDHSVRIEELPTHHRDPFDRMLIVQSESESLPIVSLDAIFDQYGVKRLW